MISYLFATIWQDEEFHHDGAVGDSYNTDSSSEDGSGASAIAVDPEEDLLPACAITTRHVRFTEEKETFACPYDRVDRRVIWYSKQDYATFRQALQTMAGQKRVAPWFQSLTVARKQLKDTHNNRQIQWILRNSDEESPVAAMVLGLEQALMAEERIRCRHRLARKIKQCQKSGAPKACKERQIRKACLAITRPSRL